MSSARNIHIYLSATESVLQSVRRLSRQEEQTAHVLAMMIFLAVTIHPVHSPAWMQHSVSSVLGNVKNMKATDSAAMDVHQSARVLLVKGELWKNVESTTWSLNSVSMKSVQRSAWMLPKEASVRQTVSNMQETLIAAYGVTVLLNARRSHCGENVLLSARSLQEIPTVVQQPVQQSAATEDEKSAVLVELRNVMESLVVVRRNLTWCLELVFIWIMKISFNRVNICYLSQCAVQPVISYLSVFLIHQINHSCAPFC